MKRLASACVLCLAVAACSRSAPTNPATSPTEAPTRGEAAADLFPVQRWEMDYIFDDGTPDTHEWWLHTPERVMAATAKGIYAVWHIRADGIYRRDPLGGDGAAMLRYLPAALQDNLVWQQESGGATVRFWLRRVPTCGGFGPMGGHSGSETWKSCWELRIHNRDQVQRFDFVHRRGVVAAHLLAAAQLGASFHKELNTTSFGHEAPPGEMAAWLGAAWDAAADSSPAPPVQPSTPEAFTAAVQAVLEPRWAPLPLDPSAPTWIIGALDAYSADPPLVLLDNGGESWYRLGAGCRHSLLTQILPALLQDCKVPPASYEPQVETDRVQAWYRNGNQLTRYAMPLAMEGKRGAVEYFTDAHRVVVPGDGTVQLDWQAGDAARHTRRITLQPSIDKNGFRDMYDVRVEWVPTGNALRYPDTAQGVLDAAFFAGWHGMGQELLLYFSNPAAATALARGDLKRYLRYDPDRIAIGHLSPVAQPGKFDPPVKLTPAAPVAGQAMDFLATGLGCCDSGADVWGTVQFSLGSGGRWQIAALDLQFAQDYPGGGRESPRPIPKP